MCFSGLCLRFSHLTVTDGHFEVLNLINSALKVMSIATLRVAYDTQIQDDKHFEFKNKDRVISFSKSVYLVMIQYDL